MIYRVDSLPENRINPISGKEYDGSWLAFKLINGTENRIIAGTGKNGIYSIHLSRFLNTDWHFDVGDFIGYCQANKLNGILVMSQTDYSEAAEKYCGHSYDEPLLRKNEAKVLIHSTTSENWERIQRDGTLKSWNRLKHEGTEGEKEPIGAKLGDLEEFRDYIMFGSGLSSEIVVSSKLSGFINTDVNSEYRPGARMYFDAGKMAQDALLVRDGAHIKVKNALPLDPYLIWAATWDKLGMENPISTPKVFAETADERFRALFNYDFPAD